jgi:hypothetical protein
MNILASEYEQSRSVFQLCDWINSKLRDLEQADDFEEVYFERRGQNIKKLLEEAIPTSRLGLYLWRPWREISITCLADDGPHDSEVTIDDRHKTETIKIEVTSTETDETTMRRQALSRHGFVFMSGPVRREGRQIMSEATMVDINKECTRLLECAFARFQMKAEQEDDPQTAILVYVNSFGSFGSMPYRYRAQLLEHTRTYLRTQCPRLYGVYYCYEADQGVDGLRNDLRELVR